MDNFVIFCCNCWLFFVFVFFSRLLTESIFWQFSFVVRLSSISRWASTVSSGFSSVGSIWSAVGSVSRSTSASFSPRWTPTPRPSPSVTASPIISSIVIVSFTSLILSSSIPTWGWTVRSFGDTVIYSNISIIDLLTVDGVSSGNRVVFVFHGDETESSGSLGSLVHDDGYFSDSTIFTKHILQLPIISVNTHSKNPQTLASLWLIPRSMMSVTLGLFRDSFVLFFGLFWCRIDWRFWSTVGSRSGPRFFSCFFFRVSRIRSRSASWTRRASWVRTGHIFLKSWYYCLKLHGFSLKAAWNQLEIGWKCTILLESLR